MAVYFSDLDDFGKGVDLNIILEKYKLYFENKFSVEQIIRAIHEHCARQTVIPKVKHINDILDPLPSKISVAEYVEAKKWQEKNGYPKFSAEAVLIREFEAQQAEDRAKPHSPPIHPQLQARTRLALQEIASNAE